MRRKSFMPLILPFLLSFGCAPSLVGKDYRITEGADRGLVVVSFTQPFPAMNWVYRDVRETKGAGGWNEKFVPISDKFSQLKYEDTILYAIELPAGEYEFFRWSTPQAGGYLRSTHDFSLRFRSVAGKATYVGNICVIMAGRKYSILVRDNREKEVALLRQHFRNIREDQIEIHLMENEGTGKKGPEKPRRSPGIQAKEERRFCGLETGEDPRALPSAIWY